MAEIDNLSIRVTSSADEAARTFDRLASSAGRLRGAASGAAGGMQDMAQGAKDAGTATQEAGTQAGKARPNIKGVGKDAKDAGDNAKKGAPGLATFWQSLKRIAYYRFIRSIIKEITSAFKEGITNLYHWSAAVNGTFAKSMDRIATSTLYLKNSLGAMVSPLINALAPALDFIIDKVVDVLNWFNQLFAVLSGASTYTVAKKVASVWADAGNSAAGSAKKAADDIKRTILGFDEINKLVDNKDRGSGSGSGYSKPSTAGSVLFEEKELSGGFKGFSNAIENALNDTLSRIGLIVSGALLAVGAILTFSGANVPLGLSMMAAGASGLVSIIGMNWDGLSADVKLAIGAVEAVVGGSLLAIGGVLAFSGVNPALGIGMMAAGAVSLASAIGLNWNLIRGKVSASAKGVVGAISAASIALGAILAFTGANVPLGVGLLAAGVTGAAATISWDWLKVKLRGQVAVITSIVSGALLALGAVLAFSGAAIPLGIGMMAAGAVGLAATATANWNTITNKLRGPLGIATALISGALLFLGAVAVASGHIPLGVGLLVAGSAGLATTISANWNILQQKLQGPIGIITGILSGATLLLGILALVGGNIPLGLGLILSGAAGLATTIAANWDNLKQLGVDAINKVKEGWESVKNAFKINILPTMDNPVIAHFLGMNTPEEIARQEEEDAGAMKFAQEYARQNNTSINVDFVANGNKSYKNSTLGKYLVNTMAKVKSKATTKVKSVAGELTKIVSGKLVPITGDTTTTNTVKGETGSFMTRTMNKFTAVVGNTDTINTVKSVAGAISTYLGGKIAPIMSDTSTTNTVNGAAGKGMVDTGGSYKGIVSNTYAFNTITGNPGTAMEWSGNGVAAIVGNTTSTNTVDAATGYGMSWTNSYSLSALTDDTSSNNYVDAVAGNGMDGSYWGLTPEVNDVDAIANIFAVPEWGWAWNLLGFLGIDNLDTDVWISAETPWWYYGKSPLQWLGLDNLKAVVNVVTNVSSTVANVINKINGKKKAAGGVYSGGRWSNIPQYAGGTAGVNHGSLFWAGENGAEIVGNAGGRTEVLNKSQIASAMYSAVQAAMAPAAANFAEAAANMGVAETGFDFETLADMVRQGVEQAMSRSNDYDRQKVELLRSINNKDFTAEVTTRQINKSQTYANRRAGTTVVAVGT